MSIEILSRITVYQTLIDIQSEIEKLGTITEQKGKEGNEKKLFPFRYNGVGV